MALRVGGVGRPDRLVRRPLGRLARLEVLLGSLASGLGAAVAPRDRARDTDRHGGDRRLPARRGRLHRTPRDRRAEPELRGHLRLRDLLARHGPPQHPARGRVSGLQPVARDRASRWRGVPPGRRTGASRAAPLSRAAGALAGGRRARGLRLARAGLRDQRVSGRGPAADDGRDRDPGLHRLHVARDAPVRGRDLAGAGRDVLRLLRDVLPARSARGARGAARDPPPAGGGDPLGRHPGSIALVVATIANTTFDGAQEGLWQSPIHSLFNRLTDIGLGPTTAFRASESIFFAITLAGVAAIYWAGVRGMRTVRGLAVAEIAGHRLRPHPDPDRGGVPGRPLLQPVRVRRAGPVHLSALGSARGRLGICSGPRRAGSTTAS